MADQEAFDIRRPSAGFGFDFPQERRGVLVRSRGEVERQNLALKAAAVHGDIIVLPAEFAEHLLELMLYRDMPAGLNIGVGHSYAIPNRSFHTACILERQFLLRTLACCGGKCPRRILGRCCLLGNYQLKAESGRG